MARRSSAETRVMTTPAVAVTAPPRSGAGLTPEVMMVAALLVLPALWRSLAQGELPLYVAMERYLMLTAGCALLSWLLHSWSESSRVVADRLERLGSPLEARPVAEQIPSLSPDPLVPFEDADVPTLAFDAPLALEPAYEEIEAPPLESLDELELPPETASS